MQLPQMIKDGQQYMDTWPMQKPLFALFPECRVIAATKFAIRVMPALAVLSVAVQLQMLGMEYVAQAIAIGVFFISLPVQGLIWLGYRSQQPLPPAIKVWYNDIYQKMRQQGYELHHGLANPKFLQLALLLKKAFQDVDKAFTARWF